MRIERRVEIVDAAVAAIEKHLADFHAGRPQSDLPAEVAQQLLAASPIALITREEYQLFCDALDEALKQIGEMFLEATNGTRH